LFFFVAKPIITSYFVDNPLKNITFSFQSGKNPIFLQKRRIFALKFPVGHRLFYLVSVNFNGKIGEYWMWQREGSSKNGGFSLILLRRDD
jgi:hypothetical protein